MGTTSEPTGNTDSNIQWLKPEQVEQMRDAAHEGRHGPRDDAILTLLYDTGLRRGELSQVDREMLDLDDGGLRIPAEIQKDYPNDSSPRPARFALDQSGQLRTVRTLRAYLNAKDGESTALFPSRKSDRVTGKGLNDVVKRAAERAAVKPYAYEGRGEVADVSAHTLRHSVAWRMPRVEEGPHALRRSEPSPARDDTDTLVTRYQEQHRSDASREAIERELQAALLVGTVGTTEVQGDQQPVFIPKLHSFFSQGSGLVSCLTEEAFDPENHISVTPVTSSVAPVRRNMTALGLRIPFRSVEVAVRSTTPSR